MSYTINRCAVVIKPKQPFVDWANNLPDRGFQTSLQEQLAVERTVYLIPEIDDNEVQGKQQIEKIWREIFEEELNDWCTNPEWWPKNITKKMFWEWFNAEIHSIITDFSDKPIHKKEW